MRFAEYGHFSSTVQSKQREAAPSGYKLFDPNKILKILKRKYQHEFIYGQKIYVTDILLVLLIRIVQEILISNCWILSFIIWVFIVVNKSIQKIWCFHFIIINYPIDSLKYKRKKLTVVINDIHVCCGPCLYDMT